MKTQMRKQTPPSFIYKTSAIIAFLLCFIVYIYIVQELGDPTAGKYLRAALKQRVQDYNDLRKGVAAVRRGGKNLP